MSVNQIVKYLNNLSVNKSTGLDGIPCKFVRDSVTIITCPLTHIINLSLIQGVVPDDLKSAKVVPLLRQMINVLLANIALCPYSVSYQRFLKGLFMTKLNPF